MFSVGLTENSGMKWNLFKIDNKGTHCIDINWVLNVIYNFEQVFVGC